MCVFQHVQQTHRVLFQLFPDWQIDKTILSSVDICELQNPSLTWSNIEIIAVVYIGFKADNWDKDGDMEIHS